jgi:multidrug efflux pump subunit AcrA (membrane-fusion protein)
MTETRIFYMQTAAPSASQDAATRDQIREQVRQTIHDAQQAAREAQQQAREAQQQAREAGRPQQIIVGPRMPDVTVMPGMPIVVDRNGFNNMIPPQVVDISIGFFVMCAVMVIGWPIARALGRRLERRGEVASLDSATAGQLQRIEQAVEAMSIEIERISESQRFMAKLQSGTAGDRGMMPSAERR